MHTALELASQALATGDVPVAALVVDPAGVIVSRATNTKERDHDPTGHAEVVALRLAGHALNTTNLSDHTLVVTLEPCVMCAGAMVNGRLGHLVYGATDPKAGAAGSCFDLVDSTVLNHRVSRTTGVLAEECGAVLKEFFRARR